ncbi:WGR domain-containing protein [Microvirga sp. BT688]|uniref:WGR domain-containing protein n=1 Tax=Microvirga sp. TaxID=1873136 RepID=UPI001681D6E4|nr:WGR domain-containing protein [Microvirga sp.]MBD2751155.1 WGR domain-containing protein [Microvirga sp.]
MPDYKIEYLVPDRCDLDANVARFYVLSIEVSLFGDAALIREWGRIGTSKDRTVRKQRQSGRGT